jgi:hypothetical protein
MTGRVKRKLRAERLDALPASEQDVVCPLCERLIPPSQRDAHHLVPKSKGGRQTTYLHRICHRQIHAWLSEAELARAYNTVEDLLAHPGIASFVAWVKTKPVDFYERTYKSQRLRSR